MTLRLKLTIGSIAAVVLANTLLSFVIVQYVEQIWLQEVQNRVELDLYSARASYNNHIESIARYLTAAALDDSIVAALQDPEDPEPCGRLRQLYVAGQMDFFALLDAAGQTVFRPRNPGSYGDNQAADPLVRAVRKTRRPASGTILLSREQLLCEGKDLAARAEFDTPTAPSTSMTDARTPVEGMVAASAVPIIGPEEELLGILLGGNLLDRRNNLVDTIKQQVFPGSSQQDAAWGNVTIFRGDLRIATNVLREDGSRALGTRMSDEVRQCVLVEGRQWAAPAFVVNDWYLTAYEPIRDPQQKVIGALYVGLLRAPFLHRQNMVMLVVLAISAVTTAACLLLVFFITTLVLRPIGRIVGMAQRVIAGDLSSRTGIRPPGEMGVLCQAIDAMAAAVAQREQQLKDLTRQQMGRSEKLASVGRLAAGVAHEINNPLTGVLTFSHLLREKPHMNDEDRQDLDLIIHETTRAAEIVRSLLDFARERATVKERMNINEVIIRVMRLISNQKKFDRITILEHLETDLPEVDGNMNQLQQVLLNLTLNACEAMPEGGTVTIHTCVRDEQVVTEVTDTGCGIKPEDMEKLFEPFFTTKPVGKGTGLGLAVSFGIVQQHGGSIEVESEVGKGSTFRVILPPATGREV